MLESLGALMMRPFAKAAADSAPATGRDSPSPTSAPCPRTSVMSGESMPSTIARSFDPIAEDGQVLRMVAEEKRAWHAGKSRWRGIEDVNSASIGIEIVNPGHEFGYRPFLEEQIDALIPLLAGIKERYGITRGNVVGHSDIAPTRKQDPGELFPWSRLAKVRLALPRPTQKLMDPMWSDAGFLIALERFGYDVSDKLAAIVAFQRRFRPELIDGVIDGECRSILLALLLPKPTGDD